MSFRTRLVAVILVAVLAIGIIYVGNSNNKQEEADKEQSYYQTETVYLWYSDDTYTDFSRMPSWHFMSSIRKSE